MAQWRKTFFSLGGPEFIADPRADEAARIAQIALQSRAQRMAEEAQLRQLAEEQRQFDQQTLFRRDELARRAEEFGWQQQQAERGFAAEQQDRMFARNRATGADAFAREQAAAQQAEAARRFGLDERRVGLDENQFADSKAARAEAARLADQRYEQHRQDEALKYAAAWADRMAEAARRQKAEEQAPIKAAAERAAEGTARREQFDYEFQKRQEAEAAARKAAYERADAEQTEQRGMRAQEIEALLAQEAAKIAASGGDLFRRTTEKVGATNNFYKNFGPFGVENGRFTAPYKALGDLMTGVTEAFRPKAVVGQDPLPAPETARQVQAVRLALTVQIKNYFNGIRERVGNDPEIDQAEAELLSRVDELAAGSPYSSVADTIPDKSFATRPSMALR